MIDQQTLLAATTKLLLESLSSEDREKLLTTALTNVLTPKKDPRGYGYPELSPLQDAFNEAAKISAVRIVKEFFDRPEVVEKMRQAVADACNKAFSEEFTQRFANKMLDGLWVKD